MVGDVEGISEFAAIPVEGGGRIVAALLVIEPGWTVRVNAKTSANRKQKFTVDWRTKATAGDGAWTDWFEEHEFDERGSDWSSSTRIRDYPESQMLRQMRVWPRHPTARITVIRDVNGVLIRCDDHGSARDRDKDFDDLVIKVIPIRQTS